MQDVTTAGNAPYILMGIINGTGVIGLIGGFLFWKIWVMIAGVTLLFLPRILIDALLSSKVAQRLYEMQENKDIQSTDSDNIE